MTQAPDRVLLVPGWDNNGGPDWTQGFWDLHLRDGDFPYLKATPAREAAEELVEALRIALSGEEFDADMEDRPAASWVPRAYAALAKVKGEKQ